MNIAYGVTTVPERIDDLLPRTLKSLETAGFTRPRLFVDGSSDPTPYWAWDADVTCRGDRIGNFGNWYLGMSELFCRNPNADRFIMFEDDIVCCRGLRDYTQRTNIPLGGYCNLYTAGDRNLITSEGKPLGWFYSDQRASGALALMFDNETVVRILGSEVFVRSRKNKNTGDMRIDGAVCLALRSDPRREIVEFCHKPSLVQHTGANLSVLDRVRQERGLRLMNADAAVSQLFPGEDFDVRTLLA